jgi:hypothetical protein
VIWTVLQYLPSPAYEMQEAGEDGVQAERSEFIVRAWTPYAVRPKRGSRRRRKTVDLGSGDPTERCRGTIAESAVWADGVVVLAPHFDDYLCFFQ